MSLLMSAVGSAAGGSASGGTGNGQYGKSRIIRVIKEKDRKKSPGPNRGIRYPGGKKSGGRP